MDKRKDSAQRLTPTRGEPEREKKGELNQLPFFSRFDFI
jgi:hypothetical protein